MAASSSNTVIAVASVRENADSLSERVERAGFSCVGTTDLGWALDETPHVLLIDPTGWKSTVHALLSGYDTRPSAPPAVLLVSEEEEILFEAGPAVDAINAETDSDALGRLIMRLSAIQQNFARLWPQQIEISGRADVSRVVHMLATRTGVEVRNDRWDLFLTAIKERIVAKLSYSLHEYERRLSGERGRRELLLLASRIVVGETYFWRYSGQMNGLKGLLTERRELLGPGRPVRIWSAGCSTGEEVYSVAMAALEVLGEDADIQVYGTDLHPLHLAQARAGAYAERTLRNLPQRLRSRWFTASGRRHKIKDELKAKVTFGQVNLVGDDLSEWVRQNGPFDSVFCRNVTIYFDTRTTKAVIARLIESLDDGGGLFLGSAETLFPLPPDMCVVHETGAFYYKKSGSQLCDSAVAAAPVAVQEELDTGLSSIYAEGLDSLGREEFGKAHDKFMQILNADQESPMGKTGMAILLANQGREIEARKMLMAVVGNGQAMAETHFMLGLLDERAGLSLDALVSYERTLAEEPTFFMAHFNRAWILKRLGRKDDFAAEMKGALHILKSSAKCPVWATGGLGLEAILGLVAEAVDQGNEARDR